MAVLGKEVQEGRPDVVDAGHIHPIGKLAVPESGSFSAKRF
jgi:hypothetical protein